MRLTKKHAVMALAGVLVVAAGVSAFLGSWELAIVAVAALQGGAVFVLMDMRERMPRSRELRKVASSVKQVQRRLTVVSETMLGVVQETGKQTAGRLEDVTRALGDQRTGQADAREQLTELASSVRSWNGRVDGWRDVLDTWHHELDDVRSQVTRTGDDVRGALEIAAKDRRDHEKLQFATTSRNIRQTEALIQLYDEVSPRASMPSSGGWAVDPTGLLTLVEIVRRTRPRLVLELGSGTSTLWLGYVLQQLGSGRLVTVDHEPRYAEATRANLRVHGLEDIVEVRVAPLVEPKLPDHSTVWYDHAVFAELSDIDILIVDGPPQATGPLARYPAVAKLAAQLSPAALVALDDAIRPDEREIVQRWEAEHPGLRTIAVPPGDGVKVLARHETGADAEAGT